MQVTINTWRIIQIVIQLATNTPPPFSYARVSRNMAWEISFTIGLL